MSKRTKNVSPAKTTTLWMKWRDFSPPQKRNHSKVWLYVGQSRRLTIIYHEVNIGSILKSEFCLQSRFQQHIGINYELFSLFCGVFFWIDDCPWEFPLLHQWFHQYCSVWRCFSDRWYYVNRKKNPIIFYHRKQSLKTKVSKQLLFKALLSKAALWIWTYKIWHIDYILKYIKGTFNVLNIIIF